MIFLYNMYGNFKKTNTVISLDFRHPQGRLHARPNVLIGH